MKKILLTACLGIGAFIGATHANSLNVINLLSGPVYLHLYGVNPDGTYFSSGANTFGSVPTTFTDPTTVPGMTNAQATGRFTSASGWCPPDLAVGSPSFSGPPQIQDVPAMPGNDCSNGASFTIKWVENPTAPNNVTILIF